MRAPTTLGLVVAAAACAIGCRARPPLPASSAHYQVPLAAPRVSRSTVDGSWFSVTDERGAVVVVSFFDKACASCTAVNAELERLRGDYGDVTFVAVDEDETEQDAADARKAQKLGFTVVHDRGKTLASRFRVRSMPVVYVIDRESVLRWVADDESSIAGDLRQAIRALR